MKRILPILLFAFAVSVTAQSGRVAPGGNGSESAQTSPSGDLSVKQMFEDASGYVRTKAAEFDAKKIPFSDDLFEKTKLEQRQLAAKYAAIAQSRVGLTGEDFYYLGLLNFIPDNLDGTIQNLLKYLASENAEPERSQRSRSVVVVALAKQNKTADAEKMLAEYNAATPKKLTETSRIEGELAKAYQAQKDFARMAPHAEAAYLASKDLLKEASSQARSLDEILDAAMLVFEAYRDLGKREKAESALDEMRATAASVGSTTFYYYAVDQKIKYLIDIGRKPAAMEFYQAAVNGVSKDFTDKGSQNEIVGRLRKREKHYKLLGEPAPEMPAIDQWFPGKQRTIADMKGNVVLLDFWAIWCGPCFGGFPSLAEWQTEFRPEGFEILGVTRYYGSVNGLPADGPHEIEYLKATRLSEHLPYDMVVARDQSIQNLYGATALPTAVIIDRKGVIRYIETGTSPSRLGEMREMIVKLLAEK